MWHLHVINLGVTERTCICWFLLAKRVLEIDLKLDSEPLLETLIFLALSRNYSNRVFQMTCETKSELVRRVRQCGRQFCHSAMDNKRR